MTSTIQNGEGVEVRRNPEDCEWTYCPSCKTGSLDTGYECNACGFDALPLVHLQEACEASGDRMHPSGLYQREIDNPIRQSLAREPATADVEREWQQAIGAEIDRQCGIGAGTCGTADDGSGLFEVHASLDLNGFAKAMRAFAAPSSEPAIAEGELVKSDEWHRGWHIGKSFFGYQFQHPAFDPEKDNDWRHGTAATIQDARDEIDRLLADDAEWTEASRVLRAEALAQSSTPPASKGVEAVAWCSPGQLANLTDVDADGGIYLPIRKTKRGNFTMPLYALPLDKGEWSDDQLKDAVTELLSHRGERPYRILRGGHVLWETWLPAFRAALRYLPAASPTPSNDTLQGRGEVELPSRCDGKEQHAFEEWASGQRYAMDEHPLHYLFLDPRTAAARDGWAAGLAYTVAQVSAALQKDTRHDG